MLASRSSGRTGSLLLSVCTDIQIIKKICLHWAKPFWGARKTTGYAGGSKKLTALRTKNSFALSVKTVCPLSWKQALNKIDGSGKLITFFHLFNFTFILFSFLPFSISRFSVLRLGLFLFFIFSFFRFTLFLSICFFSLCYFPFPSFPPTLLAFSSFFFRIFYILFLVHRFLCCCRKDGLVTILIKNKGIFCEHICDG